MAPEGTPTGNAVTAARPGHADLAGIQKYDREDIRDILERASARETAARVAAGGIAKQLLTGCGIKIVSQVTNIGGISAQPQPNRQLGDSLLHCPDPLAEAEMIKAIDDARQRGDTLGGIFEVAVLNVLPGLGSHVQWDRRLDTRLSAALMSIQAVKGVEIGDGFAYAGLPGSQAHDELFYDQQNGYYRKSNHAGGVEGGMSNGSTIVVRAAMKPIPTLMTPLASVDIMSHEQVTANTERSDICAVPAAAVVGEAMVSLVIAEALLDKFGGDSFGDLSAAIKHYRERIGR